MSQLVGFVSFRERADNSSPLVEQLERIGKIGCMQMSKIGVLELIARLELIRHWLVLELFAHEQMLGRLEPQAVHSLSLQPERHHRL